MYGNRFRSVPMIPLLIVLSFLLAGCYTMLKHPRIEQEESYVEEEGVQRARSCTDCHTEMHADVYYHDPFYRYDPFWVRRPFYTRSYYSRWQYYRSYPWWWDRYERRYHYRDREPYYPQSDKKDEPREETKRDWHRRSGFGTGGGIGIGAPQVRSRPLQPSEEKAKPESAKVQKAEPKSSGASKESKKEEKKEEKEEEKKQEGRSRRRKGFN